jgi:hypothetical protein
MPFDENKLSRQAREWLAGYLDLLAEYKHLPDVGRSEFVASVYESRANLAIRLAKAGRSDTEIENTLRSAIDREFAAARQHPKYHRGQDEFYGEAVSQAVQAAARARRKSDDRVKARKEAKAAAEVAADKDVWEEAMQEAIGTA